jgi:hypothetical protein
MRSIRFVNESTLVPNNLLTSVLGALQLQVNRDFNPAWGIDAFLQVAPGIIRSQESIVLLDDSDQADALGYHEIVADTDVPIGFVFVRTCQEAGVSWSSCASHELLEQLADPWCFGLVDVAWGGKPAAVALEVCDPVEADAYWVGGVEVSNFVLPTWFQSGAAGMAGYDYLRKVRTPLAVSAGGYLSLTQDLALWQQITDDARKIRPHRLKIQQSGYARKNRRGK